MSLINSIKQFDNFDLNKIKLNDDKKLQILSDNVYMIKVTNNENNPILIQTPLCKINYSLLKNRCKTNIDISNLYKLQLSIQKQKNNDIDLNFVTSFNNFIDNLENRIKNLILENSSKWFNNFDEDDIDFFYKNILEYSNNENDIYYTYFDIDNILERPNIKYYDDSLLILNDLSKLENIDNRLCSCILECRGVIFTSDKFYLCFVIKQILFSSINKDNYDNEIDKCLFTKIKLNKKHKENHKQQQEQQEEGQQKQQEQQEQYQELNEKKNSNYLEEINIDIDNISETNKDEFKLKKPNEIYKDIYNEIKKRAYEYRKKSLQSYLEAKHIKNTYLLDEIDTSDSENSEINSIENENESILTTETDNENISYNYN